MRRYTGTVATIVTSTNSVVCIAATFGMVFAKYLDRRWFYRKPCQKAYQWRELSKGEFQSLENRRKVARLSVFYGIYHGEYPTELHNSIPPYHIHHWSTRCRPSCYRYYTNAHKSVLFHIYMAYSCNTSLGLFQGESEYRLHLSRCMEHASTVDFILTFLSRAMEIKYALITHKNNKI